MSHINKLRYQTLELVPEQDEAARKLVSSVFDTLTELNKSNVAALLPIRTIELHSRDLDLSDLTFGEDYEVGQSFKTYDGEEFETYDAVTEAIDAQESKNSELEDQVAELEDKIEKLEKEHEIDAASADEDNQRRKKLAKIKLVLQKVETELETGKERLEQLEKARDEPEYDEIMWNTVWQPDGDAIDEDLAHRIPNLGVINLLKEDETFIGLTGCGMDLSPCIMAYCVLSTGMVDPEHARYFTREQDIDYATHVIGRTLLLECAEKMKVREAFELKLAKLDAEHTAARKAEKAKQKRLTKIRQTRPSARLLAHVEALKAYNETLPEGTRETRLSLSDLQAFIASLTVDEYNKEPQRDKAVLKQLHRDLAELKLYIQAFFFNHTGLDDLVNAGLPKPAEE